MLIQQECLLVHSLSFNANKSLCPSLFEFQLPGLTISLRPNSDQIAILMPLVIGSQLDVRIAEPLTLKFEVKKVS